MYKSVNRRDIVADHVFTCLRDNMSCDVTQGH